MVEWSPNETNPPPPTRRGLLSALAAAVALLLAALGGYTAGNQTAPAPAVRQVAVLDDQGGDYFGVTVGGTLLQGTRAAAPLTTWLNNDLRDRTVMNWCLAGLPDEASRARARQVLTEIYGWYAGTLPGWQEGCNGTYEVDDAAHDDCGIGDGAVGCAVYFGPRKVKVSFNGRMYRDGRLNLEGVTGALSHELGHTFTLDHVPCNHPQPSSMSGIALPGGPPCAAQGTNRPIREDYRLAESLYTLPGPSAPPPAPPPLLTEYERGFRDGFNQRFDATFNLGYCAAVRAYELGHPGCP